MLNITPEFILTEIGYGNIAPEPLVSDALQTLFLQIQKEIRPECTFVIKEGFIRGPEVMIDSVALRSGDSINSLLKNSDCFALFAATAGWRFQQIIDEVKEEGDPLKIYLLDIVGSWIAEKAGDCMEKYLEDEIGGVAHTNRFSPGYCGWHLSGQEQLFSLMGGNPCDISLSEVFLMTPIKSISGIIGIGEQVSRKVYACDICELETCYKKSKTISEK